MQIGEKIAENKKNVVFISLEMAYTQLIEKMISRRTNINSYKMKMGTIENDIEWQKIADASRIIADLPITISTNVRTIQDIEYYAKTLKNQNKIDLMIIDYIQLLRDKDSFQSREQEVADISRRLKLLTLDLNIPIIALCQLNRNANEREPSMADLRESGSLEQDADNIIFIYQENPENIILKLAKQRNGDTGKVKVKFEKSISSFISYTL